MQDNQQTLNPSEDEQYREFKRIKRIEEAKASVLKIECDCLAPTVDRAYLKEICRDANTVELGSIVVFPAHVKSCVSFLGKDPKVSLIAAISYPCGADATEIKVAAVKRAVKDGVDEVEVSAPTSFIKEGNWAYFKKECKKIKKAAKQRAARIALDCSALSEKELNKACQTAADAGINCIRLNNTDGETVAGVKAALKGKCLIKADRAENAVAFANLNTMGGDYVGCLSACQLATFLIKQAEAE